MDTFVVFNLQFTFSFILFALLARWYAMPRLRALPAGEALALALFPGATRFMGLVFLVSSVTPGMPAAFGVPAAYGDTLSAIIALAALLANRAGSPAGRPLAWLYVVVGGADLAYGLFLGFQHQLWNHLGGAWTYIIFAFPVVVLGLIVTTRLLLSPQKEADGRALSPAPAR
jgi:hypothetical protein